MRIPKNKYDIDFYDFTTDSEELRSFVVENSNQLLIWTKDGSWPVFDPIIKILKSNFNEISDNIDIVLQGDDFEWSFALIEGLLLTIENPLSNNTKLELIQLLKRLYIHFDVFKEMALVITEVLERELIKDKNLER